MKKFILLSVSVFFFTLLPAKEASKDFKSRVIFKKNPSQSEIAEWEKEFFGNYEAEFAEKIIDDTDNENPVIKDIEPVRRKAAIPLRSEKQVKSGEKNAKQVVEKNSEIIEEADDAKDDKLLQQPEKTVKKQKYNSEEPVKDNDPAIVEQNDSDNEVDRSGQIRKMKELLKKRKGKSRIEDRRIY